MHVNKFRQLGNVLLGSAFLLGSHAFAQAVDVTDATAQDGGTAQASVSWTDGGSDAVAVSFDFQHPFDPTAAPYDDYAAVVTDVFSGDDVPCTTSPTTIAPNVTVTCNLSVSGDDTVARVFLEQGANNPLGDFADYVRFEYTIAAGTAAQTETVDVIFESFDDVGGSLGTGATDFLIEVTEGPPPPESSLAISPDPMAFGTVDLGNMPVTDTFTVTIGGDADADDVTISDVTLSGDGEFTVSADSCEGNTFSVPNTCTIEITFDAAANGSFAGSIEVTSDADNTPVVSADITGAADSVANVVVTPGFGPVNLGFGAPGTTVSANGNLQNTGSAPGDVSCTLAGDAVFSTDPSPLTAVVDPGATVPFSLSCALPSDAEEGDEFSATLTCEVDGEFAGEHNLSCGVSTFEPLPVPTMQAWALALFALMMLLAGAIGIRFFRA